MTTELLDKGWPCGEITDRLYEYLDQELESVERAAVQRHLGGCAACRRQFEFEDQFLARMRLAARGPQAPTRLRFKVTELLARQ
jgi:mycothiol system anti-sigma-R factor